MSPGISSPESEFRAAVDRLVGRVRHWTPTRWSKPTAAGDLTRAALVHALAQRLADAGAGASGEPHRAVPRLDNDLALPDQLRVLATDVLAAPAPADLLDALTNSVRAAGGQLA